MRHRSGIAFIVLLAAFVCACGDSSSPTSPSPNANVPFSQTDLTVGTGADAIVGRTLIVNYSGWLYDSAAIDHKGRLFESGQYSFRLGAGTVIRGWDQGLAGMKVGGRRRLVLPPDLAYGASGSGSTIPPNATLIFDVELLAAQ